MHLQLIAVRSCDQFIINRFVELESIYNYSLCGTGMHLQLIAVRSCDQFIINRFVELESIYNYSLCGA
jgi:hypothetical protein